ncbi:cyanase [Saccharopolyspora phatthalungensis]|uniref:Cyanate hydratase n=1 Tax=Saccharopolyspora phatthalungensis TaxID=664693 RepID=A0A840PWZ6_9PSEU|nr:cyanase [Saccharopolyspora phatthalungensis]MBB5152836.1 cyanate lyase [Saccharopolyspora phatthalungensis]
MIGKLEAGELIAAERARREVSWREISEAIDKPLLWTIAALLGQHPVGREDAEKVADLLDLDQATVDALRRQPYRGTTEVVPTDPTVYRFYEVLQVYGGAIKEAIHEEFGDGIMSAINFKIDVERRLDPEGDRVVVTLDGKFLDYRW